MMLRSSLNLGFLSMIFLKKETSLQNKLLNILIGTRFHTIILCDDIEKAFL